jgi:branched-chain amino acid transport system ATP-binding protein
VTTITPLLAVENLQVAYDELVVVQDISFTVEHGAVVSLLGPNGAGKSTTMTAIAGGLRTLRGRIRYAGADLVGRKPEQIAAMGVSFVPEGRHVFTSLSVKENLMVGAYMRHDDGPLSQRLDRIYHYFPRLKERWQSPAGQLSGGEQQMLVIGRALMTQPKLMMIDEPSLGLGPRIVDQVYEILLELRRAQGLTLLVNEQSSRRALSYSDRICVLRNGSIRLQDAAERLRDGVAIQRAYFGFDMPVSEGRGVTP